MKATIILLLSMSACSGTAVSAAEKIHTWSMAARAETRLELVGEVDDDMAERLVRELEVAKGAVTLRINSPGGSVDAGWKIMNALEAAKAQVSCVVDGEADSMALYILQSCRVRMMTKRSVLMAHEVSAGGMFFGNPNEWQARADYLRTLQDALLEQLASRSKISIAELKSHTDGGRQWWFGWREALDRGVVDRIETASVQ